MRIIARCWSCGKEHDISDLPVDARAVKCSSCDGYVISPSGKVLSRIVDDDTSHTTERV